MDPVLPSPEKLFVAWATAHPTLAATHGGRVATKLSSVRPCLRVQRLGSPQTQRWEDAPELQVEAWAEDETVADDLIRDVVAALPDIIGPHPGAYVTRFDVTLGPLLVPDEGTDLSRYLLQIALRTHPHGG